MSKEKIERSERERRAARAAGTEWARKNSPPFGPIDDARRAVLAGGDWFDYTPGELQRARAARGLLRNWEEREEVARLGCERSHGPMGVGAPKVGALATPAEVRRARGAEDNDPGPKKNWRRELQTYLEVGFLLLCAGSMLYLPVLALVNFIAEGTK